MLQGHLPHTQGQVTGWEQDNWLIQLIKNVKLHILYFKLRVHEYFIHVYFLFNFSLGFLVHLYEFYPLLGHFSLLPTHLYVGVSVFYGIAEGHDFIFLLDHWSISYVVIKIRKFGFAIFEKVKVAWTKNDLVFDPVEIVETLQKINLT